MNKMRNEEEITIGYKIRKINEIYKKIKPEINQEKIKELGKVEYLSSLWKLYHNISNFSEFKLDDPVEVVARMINYNLNTKGYLSVRKITEKLGVSFFQAYTLSRSFGETEIEYMMKNDLSYLEMLVILDFKLESGKTTEELTDAYKNIKKMAKEIANITKENPASIIHKIIMNSDKIGEIDFRKIREIEIHFLTKQNNYFVPEGNINIGTLKQLFPKI